MKTSTKIWLIIALATLTLLALQALRISELNEERERYRSNTTALLRDVDHYRTQDSLNVARAEVLTLKISELERYRAEDVKTIESLKIRKRDLEQITAAQSRMIADLRGTVADTIIIYADRNDPDTLQALHVSDEWIDMHGVIYGGYFDGTLEVRDSIVVVESVKRKRFLGFLWRTNKVVSREVDVMSKNPYTQIIGVESVTINK